MNARQRRKKSRKEKRMNRAFQELFVPTAHWLKEHFVDKHPAKLLIKAYEDAQ